MEQPADPAHKINDYDHERPFTIWDGIGLVEGCYGGVCE